MNSTIYTFGHPETTIKEYKHWVVMIRLTQTTIGSLVLAAKSQEHHLGNLTIEEWAEFAQVSKDVETMLRRAFGAEKFNYLALMMKDPHVHFHLIPRYSKPVEFEAKTYKDPDWPLKTELGELDIDKATFIKIKEKLVASLA